MNDYEVRSATNGDSDTIKELVFAVLREYQLQPDPNGTDADLNDIETSYLRSGGRFDVLVDSRGVIVGSVGLYPIDSATCELRKMYLSQQVRGQGQGRRLLEYALAQAKKEAGAWPYAWVADADYPHKAERGTVTGQLTLHDQSHRARDGLDLER